VKAALAAAVATAIALGTGCAGDSGSDITVAYRGDVSSYRQLARVRYDAGNQGRVVVPAFPSAAKAEPIATSGEMQVVVSLKSGDGTVLARDSVPPLALAARMSYGVNVVVSTRRPAETRCSGRWRATSIAPPAAESLYVSVTAERRGNPPRCDD